MKTTYFKEQIFVYPFGDDANQSIAQHPHMAQEQANIKTECYFGKNMIVLPTYTVEKMIFEGFKRSRVALFAFIQKEKNGKAQYFYCQKLETIPKKKLSAFQKKLLALSKQSAMEAV